MGVVQRQSGMSHKDLFNLLQSLAYTLLDFPNLRTGTTATRVRVDAFAFRIGAQVYSKAAEDNVQVTGLTNTSATQARKVRVHVNTAGTLSFTEGAPASAQAVALIPRRAENLVTVGWIEIPPSFTYGTTNFSAAGVTIRSGDPDLGAGSGIPPNDRGLASGVITA